MPTTTSQPASSGLRDFDPKGLLNDSRVHPKVREMAAKTAATLQAQGFRPLLAEAYRTIADQRKAFERGASQVTFGWHNTGLAIDIVHYNKAGTGPSWLGDDKALAARFWPAVGKAGLDAGFTEWGGNWTGFVDRPHLQYSPSRITLATAKSKFESGGIPAVWQSAVA
jgi:peptidoglycan L-alanyl-D-glutamate endopeptidase CwlK